MDLERLEQWVLRCPLQELTFRDASGVYVFGMFHSRPAWWFVRYKSGERSAWTVYEVRGLTQVIQVIEQRYPALYAWLVGLFPADEMG